MPRTLRATSRTAPFACSVVAFFGFVAMKFSFWLAVVHPRRTWPADVAAARPLFKVSRHSTTNAAHNVGSARSGDPLARCPPRLRYAETGVRTRVRSKGSDD